VTAGAAAQALSDQGGLDDPGADPPSRAREMLGRLGFDMSSA